MAKLISASARIERARQLIQEAHDFPVPQGLGKNDLSYIAGVKDLLRQARDLVKFIPMRAGVSDEMKAEVQKILEEADQADREVLHGGS
jgi:D-ribose pyranose/furanose isomerase RbsD